MIKTKHKLVQEKKLPVINLKDYYKVEALVTEPVEVTAELPIFEY